jgi:hypothetical protein
MNPAVLATIAAAVGGAVGKVLLSLATSLLTETVLKRVIILLLERVSAKTENDLDNQLLAIAKEAWEAPKLPVQGEP